MRNLFCLCAMVFISCSQKEIEVTYANQEQLIDTYVTTYLSKNPETRVCYSNGTVKLVLTEGEGIELNSRGKVQIEYIGYDFTKGISNSTIFATNRKSAAESANWNLTDDSIFVPLTISMKDKDIIEGLREGLIGVKEGEECLILFCGKYGFGKNQIGTIPANAPLAYQIQVLSIEN